MPKAKAEEVLCKWCKKTFLRAINKGLNRNKGKIAKGLRQSNAVTCTTKCSRAYAIQQRRLKTRDHRKKMREVIRNAS